MFEGLDQLTFGSALIEAARRTSGTGALYPGLDPQREPYLAQAVEAGEPDTAALFENSVRTYLRGFEPLVARS